MRGPLALAATALLALLATVAPALATPYIHAHRGGPYELGVAKYSENTMPAFEAAAAQGFVLELDVKLTKDRKAVVIHDDTLDRTTNCTGALKDRTLAEVSACRADVLGVPPPNPPASSLIANPTVLVPTLAEVLELAKVSRARLNIEIKNLPIDNDFDTSSAYATEIMNVVKAAGLPRSQLLIQSFYPPNLDVAKSAIPGVETSLLTLAPLNEPSPEFSTARAYEFASPEWSADFAARAPEYIAKAHAAGRRVVPYTLDTPAEIADAARKGVDELITNDPQTARRVVALAAPAAATPPPPPTPEQCAGTRANRSRAPVEAYDSSQPDTPRVFAMQYKQEIKNVESYAAFRRKIECMILEYVKPRLAAGRTNVIAFNEDVGLATIATGTRGAAAREAFGRPGSPSCESEGAPCATVAALGAVTTGYTKENAAYRERFAASNTTPVSDAFVAATDTFGRGWMQVFSDMAKRYDVYILGSNNQSPFRESVDPSEIATFQDPDQPGPSSVFVATSDAVFNEVFMWAPSDVRQEGPRPLRNVVVSNKKVPATPIERQLQISDGPSTGPDGIENVVPYALPGTQAKVAFATSLPAFIYGNPPKPAGGWCVNTAKYYMRCLDELGANLVMQDEANPARWASKAPFWQPLEWMSSTWRAAADPDVGFTYNVTPHMVGNLTDLAFDGQTAITQRGLTGPGCHYVGDAAWVEGEDPAGYKQYAGPKPEFLALVPWVVGDGPRSALRTTGGKLAPGSGDALENDYLETAVAADLPFPANPSRAGCLSDPPPPPAPDPDPDPDPAAPPGFFAPQDGAKKDPPSEQQPQKPAVEKPAVEKPAPTVCTSAAGFETVSVQPRGRRVEMRFRRRVHQPVQIDVFQQSVGPRVIGERLVARFSNRDRGVTWDGRANRSGRSVTDGHYFARYRLRRPDGQIETRRVALRRAGGRFTVRGAFQRRESCGVLRSFKLTRPVFGGPRRRALGLSYELGRTAIVRLTVLRGDRVVKRIVAVERRAGKTYRVRFGATGRPPGDYRFRITVAGRAKSTTATLTARRL